MANDKPGGGWTIGYTTEEVREQLEKKERKLRDYDASCRGETTTTSNKVDSILLHTPNKK